MEFLSSYYIINIKKTPTEFPHVVRKTKPSAVFFSLVERRSMHVNRIFIIFSLLIHPSDTELKTKNSLSIFACFDLAIRFSPIALISFVVSEYTTTDRLLNHVNGRQFFYGREQKFNAVLFNLSRCLHVDE